MARELLIKSTENFQDNINLYNNVFKAWNFSLINQLNDSSKIYG